MRSIGLNPACQTLHPPFPALKTYPSLIHPQPRQSQRERLVLEIGKTGKSLRVSIRLETASSCIGTKARMMAMFTYTARSLFRTLESMGSSNKRKIEIVAIYTIKVYMIVMAEKLKPT